MKRIYYPEHSGLFIPGLREGQRYRHGYNDLRLERTHEQIVMRMASQRTASIEKLSNKESEAKRFYRFLGNKEVGLPELMYRAVEVDAQAVANRALLVLQDTTGIGVVHRAGTRQARQEAFGVLDDNEQPGLYVHPSVLLDANSPQVMGLGHISIHCRPKAIYANKDAHSKARVERRGLPFRHKESSVWLCSAEYLARQLRGAARLIHVMDRGADIYESIARMLILPNTEVLLRMASTERKLEGKPQGCAAMQSDKEVQCKVSDLLAHTPIAGSQCFQIRPLDHYGKTKGKRIVRKKRQALLHIKYAPIQLMPTVQPAGDDPIPQITTQLYVVEVFEDCSTVPHAEESINWTLLSSLPITDVHAAWDAVAKYRLRWLIEQLFRILKDDGLGIGRVLIKDPEKLKKLIVMATQTAVEILKLTTARHPDPFIPIDAVFDADSQKVLHHLLPALQNPNPSAKCRNPYSSNSLAWAVWIIARLGSWKGNPLSPPGPKTIARGLAIFRSIEYGFSLSKIDT